MTLPHLFSPVTIARTEIRNRIVFTGHHTHLADGLVSDDLVAYHETRAAGGAGLIVVEIATIHDTGVFAANCLDARSADCIPGYRRLAGAVRRHGARLFGQLFHPGREVQARTDGLMATAIAPSPVANERFHIMPRAMSGALIEEVIEGFAQGAGYLAEAGLDGVELVASHGYLPAQFLNPRLNLRDDAWGGSFDRRLRFVEETLSAMRAAIGDATLGMRISGDELDPAQGLTADDVEDIAGALAHRLDYISVVAGMSSTLGASIHIAAPMGIPAGYIAPLARRVKEASGLPVIATGRINQPQIAEGILASGDADLCGMTRAMISDPAMALKALEGRFDDIRACIACNQACIGHSHKGVAISCIQNPASGRERRYGTCLPSRIARSVMVAGGGPAGLKAAAVAASRGHRVTLHEAGDVPGGQACHAAMLPGRAEFGGLVQNLEHEARSAGAEIRTGSTVTPRLVEECEPDAVIVATGARPWRPPIEGEAHVVEAIALLDGANVGHSVVIADGRADWTGLGLAEMLAEAGHRVRLVVNGAMAGELLQLYVRNHHVGRLRRLGVDIITHARLFGADDDVAYFQDTLTGEAIILEEMDSLVLSLGPVPHDDLGLGLEAAGRPFVRIGDCLAPRSAEEAVLEGLEAAWSL